MSSVLVGMFDTRSAAEQAQAHLVAAGFRPTAVSASEDPDTEAPQKEGGFMHFVHSIFGSDDSDDRTAHTPRFKEAFRRGAFGLTVATTSDDDTERASDILDEAGAIDVDERSPTEGWKGSTTGDATVGAGATLSTLADSSGTAGQGLATGATQKLNVVEESLAVGKRAVTRGGVRVFSRVVEVPVEETVRLRGERAPVQRRVVDRPATEADFAAFQEGSIEVRSTGEEAVVGKTARVVGEVEIGTQITERDEVVRETVRKTEVDVEELPGVATTTTGTTTSMPGTAPKL